MKERMLVNGIALTDLFSTMACGVNHFVLSYHRNGRTRDTPIIQGSLNIIVETLNASVGSTHLSLTPHRFHHAYPILAQDLTNIGLLVPALEQPLCQVR